jgi:hypothetical protein
MAGAMLRLLEHGFNAQRFNRRAHILRLVTHDRENFLRAKRLAGPYHVLDEHTPTRAVQHFGAT